MFFLKRDKAPIKSAFPEKEEFEYDDVPKYFKSVTDKSLRETKNYCARVIARKYNNEYKPNTLLAMIQTIDGEFEQAYALLEADYNTRLLNLQKAYQDGLADIEQEMIDFRQKVSEHDEAFEGFNEIHEEVTGRSLDKNLKYSVGRLEEIEQQYKELKEK